MFSSASRRLAPRRRRRRRRIVFIRPAADLSRGRRTDKPRKATACREPHTHTHARRGSIVVRGKLGQDAAGRGERDSSRDSRGDCCCCRRGGWRGSMAPKVRCRGFLRNYMFPILERVARNFFSRFLYSQFQIWK